MSASYTSYKSINVRYYGEYCNKIAPRDLYSPLFILVWSATLTPLEHEVDQSSSKFCGTLTPFYFYCAFVHTVFCCPKFKECAYPRKLIPYIRTKHCWAQEVCWVWLGGIAVGGPCWPAECLVYCRRLFPL